MKAITLFRIVIFSIVLVQPATSDASDILPEPLKAVRNAPDDQRAEIIVLGTFHFKDAGLDEYKPKHDIDILSDRRQAELEEILALLEAFGPTKIAVEVDYSRRAKLDSSYAAYLTGEKKLTSDEIHQIGFRLAQRLGHDRVYAVDAPAGGFFSADNETHAKWEKKIAGGEEHGLNSGVWQQRYDELYTYDDSAKINHTLRETFLYMNSRERVIAGHGHYLIGIFQVSNDNEYIGPAAMLAWHERNLRIFHNLIRITESTDERILLLIGAGHAAIITHAVNASPQYHFVPVSEVLGE